MEVKEEKQQGEEKKNRASHLWENILARSVVMDWGAGAKENSSEKSWIVIRSPINDTACSN